VDRVEEVGLLGFAASKRRTLPPLTTGPTNASRSAGSPIGRRVVQAARRSTKSSWTLASTMAREQALHFCPASPKAARAIPSAAASTSA
jgi:hypothetical protein